MGAFVISKRSNGEYKFTYASRREKTLVTSISCKNKSDCELIIQHFQQHLQSFTITRIQHTSGKFHFRLSKDGLVLANSRKFTTELRLKKGIEVLQLTVAQSEVLDFSENELVFPDAQDVFGEESNS